MTIPDLAPIQPGHVLAGKYRLERLIGEGGMGRVFVARQEPLGRRVAVKVLAPLLVQEPVYLERFKREAIAAMTLDTVHTVQVLDFYEGDDRDPPFLVMEYLEGRSLLERLKEGKLPVDEALSVMGPLLTALGAAHAHDIVHRDLKPSNIFLARKNDGSTVVKLLDFGVAKLRESKGFARLTAKGDMVGTPRYAAPEQLRGSPTIDGRADLYAAGVLLYGMFAGRPPFTAVGAADLVREILQGEPVPLRTYAAELPPGLDEVVRKSMEKDPDERFQTAAEFWAALEPFESVAPELPDTRPMAVAPMPVDPTLEAPAPVPGSAPADGSVSSEAPTIARPMPRSDRPRSDAPRKRSLGPVRIALLATAALGLLLLLAAGLIVLYRSAVGPPPPSAETASAEAREDPGEELPYGATPPTPEDVLAPCPPGTRTGGFRECGWQRAGVETCRPGRRYRAACGAECGLGAGGGNALLRVCPGDEPCLLPTVLDADDDSCGGFLPLVRFRCPAEGRVSYYTAPFEDGEPYACTVEQEPLRSRRRPRRQEAPAPLAVPVPPPWSGDPEPPKDE